MISLQYSPFYPYHPHLRAHPPYFYLIGGGISFVFSESLSLSHTYLAAARSKQPDPYRMTRIDILKPYQKAQHFLSLTLLWLYPHCESPSFWKSRVMEKASVLVYTPVALNMLPQAGLCVFRHTLKHT